MLVLKAIDEVRAVLRQARSETKRIGFVATMGALHEGHLSLVQAARRECDFVAVSIFVNPTQFGPGEDFQRYPRPIESDLEKCRQAGVDLVFCPEPQEMYPQAIVTTVQVAGLTDGLCGRYRPGHFNGVTTVVSKLFNIVAPDVTFFGQKDAQQALVIRRMVRDLNFPIQLRICPTVRSETGLALSSRNQYLSPEGLIQAVSLHRSLQSARQKIAQGVRSVPAIVEDMRRDIESAGPCEIQYIEMTDAETLEAVETVDRAVLVALAVKVEQTRLIDNIMIDSQGNEIVL